jgi:hypothetical protein
MLKALNRRVSLAPDRGIGFQPMGSAGMVSSLAAKANLPSENVP